MTKDAHEVEQNEPAAAGRPGQPPGSWIYDRLRHAHRGFCFCRQLKGSRHEQLRRDRHLRGELGVGAHAPDSRFAGSIPRPLPVAEAVSSDAASLFVANQDDNNIVQFVIGSDGKLYPYNTVNTPGVFPLASGGEPANLFVVDTYQPLPTCSTAAPCSGSVAVFPLTGRRPAQRPWRWIAGCEWEHQLELLAADGGRQAERCDCANGDCRACFRDRCLRDGIRHVGEPDGGLHFWIFSGFWRRSDIRWQDRRSRPGFGLQRSRATRVGPTCTRPITLGTTCWRTRLHRES